MTNNPEPNPESRSCGSCYACCVYLGISELKKHPGTTCTYLDGALGPNTRCSIYSSRPNACSNYKCAYLNGFGSLSDRPDKTGILITSYLDLNLPETSLSTFLTTLVILDPIKSQYPNLNDPSPINSAIKLITQFSSGDIRIVNYFRKEVILFSKGEILKAKLLSQEKGNFETLTFKTERKIGTYLSQPISTSS